MISYRTYPAILSTATVVAAFALSITLAAIWPDICWLPRVGGTLAGLSVFLHGYIHVNKERFDVPWRWGLTRDQAYTHFANIAAVFGTFMAAFGDLLPKILWVSNCACIATC